MNSANSKKGTFNNKKNKSSFILLRGIWKYLNKKRKKQIFFISLIMLCSGLSELISLGAVVPFLAIILDPERIWAEPFFNNIFIKLGFSSADQLILPVTISFIIAALIATIIRSFNLFLNIKIAAVVGSDLSCEVYKRTILQPYSIHLKLNSSDVITTMTTHIGRTVTGLNAFLQLATSSIVALGILLGLLLINFKIAFSLVFFIGIIYLCFAFFTRNKLLENGKLISIYSKNLVKALQEGLGAIREVLMRANQDFYLEIYKKNDRPQRVLQAENNFLSVFPRFAFEGLGIVILALLSFLLILQNTDKVKVISLLGAFALGAQRLLPAFQQIYGGWSSLRGLNADLNAVLEFLEQQIIYSKNPNKKLSFNSNFKFEAVSFSYEKGLPNVLKEINIKINKGERVGLIGSTGSGKSTFIDIVMSLLKPTQGKFTVDDVDINNHADMFKSAAWRLNIAHVPQSIFLADCSIAENIAFGIPFNSINFNRLKECADQAQISKFIEKTPNGYQSFVGERGVKLSGGQRQRIGIARALYLKKEVLVFDEATSALDRRTENLIMKTIDELPKEYTVIIIAHRLSTLKSCDRVIKIENGIVVADGNPKSILIS